MLKDQREGWLAELHVGQRVVVVSCNVYRTEQIGMVQKITPTGKMDIDGTRFSPQGWSNGYRIEPLTVEKNKQIRRRKMISRIELMIDYWKRSPDGMYEKDKMLELFDYDELSQIFDKFNNWHELVKKERETD